MPFAHLTLATPDIDRTAAFLERTLGYARKLMPANSRGDAIWLDLGHGQELHVLRVPGFERSAFEAEYGRHVALFHPLPDFPALKARLTGEGAVLIDPIRPTPFERFFFREPVNGYVFEIIDDHINQARASHLDQ
jgi:catechol 2,3-dioxygenase-like lactoylglutathione lyase family enzyme